LSFFEPSPPPPERPPPGRQPPWLSPPENEIGVSVPLRVVLARNDELAVALVDVVAYSTGFALRLALRIHPDATDFDPRQMMTQFHGGPMGSADERLRFGVEFSDGRKATNLGPRRPPGPEAPPISLAPHGGGGGGGRGWQTGYWIFPLPPPGSLTVAIGWPARRIAEETHTLDVQPIIQAATGSLVLWQDTRPIRKRDPA
jgi:hypothetical protein